MTAIIALENFTERAYLNYAMYVILDRALPQLADGLKPVQRRILYAMYDLDLSENSKPKKAARTVGDVIGKFHPHGDSACYEAMVLMAQPFSYRYPLIEGQGNWGSADDPKSFAAMRYTEARLSRYAALLLGEVEQGTVNWQANFDGTLQEPKTLPAQLPFILLNGTSGIAVGLATDIPPHNLSGIVESLILLLEKPEASLKEVLQHVIGPDVPSGGQLISSYEDLEKIYATGVGQYRLRGLYHEEKQSLVIDALPYQVSGARFLEAVANLMKNKKMTQIEDLRDESDAEQPLRLVLFLKKGSDVNDVIAFLAAHTDFEKSFRVNINLIDLEGRPRNFSLLELLKQWLSFRRDTVRRRLRYRLEKIAQRLLILQALYLVYLHLEAVLAIIRHSDEPKNELMQKFGLNALQAEAVLEMRLRQLAKLESLKIEKEQKSLSAEKNELEALLASDKKLDQLLKKELKKILQDYGDARRTIHLPAAILTPPSLSIPAEAVTVILSARAWIRAAKGHESLPAQWTFRDGDHLLDFSRSYSDWPLLLADTQGRVYPLSFNELPSGRSMGTPVTQYLKVTDGTVFTKILSSPLEQHWLWLTDSGYGFRIAMQDLLTRQRSGKQIMKLKADAQLFPPLALIGDYLAVLTNQGRLQVVSVEELPLLKKGHGEKLLYLDNKKAEKMKDVLLLTATDQLRLQGRIRLTLSPVQWQEYLNNKGGRPKVLPAALGIVEAFTKA
jgi:topoisomerase-4 subunit A